MTTNYRKTVLPAALAFALTALAADYAAIARKAARFFEFEEWASASAMYELMLAERPRDVDTYASAIVAAYENADTTKALNLFSRAQRSLVPFDSLLDATRKTSFSIGEPRLYEDFLLRLQTDNPSIARPIDSYLLKYYMFRHNAEKTLEYTEKLAADAPERREFLLDAMEGLINTENYSRAINIARRLINDNPDDFDALVGLGIIASLQIDRAKSASDAQAMREMAIDALSRANKLRSTSKLRELLTTLSKK